MNRTTILRVIVECEYAGDEFGDNRIPANTRVSELVSVALPRVEEKYIEFPKVIQGVIMAAYSRHSNAVVDALIKQAKEEDKAKKESEERQRIDLFTNGRNNLAEEFGVKLREVFPETEVDVEVEIG